MPLTPVSYAGEVHDDHGNSHRPILMGRSRKRTVAHSALAATLTGRAIAGHLTLPLLLTVRGLPFLGLLLLRPSESTLLVAGAQVRDGRLPLVLAVAAAAIGAVSADLLGYLAGRLWGSAAVNRLTGRHTHGAGRLVVRAQDLVRDRGTLAVVAARPMVITHGIVPVLAGVAGMAVGRFLAAALAGAVVWAAAWIAGGAGLVAAWSALPVPARYAVAGTALAVALSYAAACVVRRSCPRLGTVLNGA